MMDVCRKGPAWAMVAFAAMAFIGPVAATTYYVDYDGGDDAAAGTSAETAFKHCPGDPAATGAAKAVALQAGDTVIFKGGVRYRGTVAGKASGVEGKPIVYDGNTAETFGKGRAVIDGSQPVTGWKRCESAEEAKGNPRWKDIFYADVPKPYGWNLLNLCDEEKSLPIAQDPNPSDPIFQEDPKDYYVVETTLAQQCPAKIYAEEGTHPNRDRPLILMITAERGSAVVDPIAGGAFTVEVPKAVTVTAVGIAPQPNYAAVKEVAFYGDGKELVRVSLKKDEKDVQKFELPAPATFSKFTVKLLSAHEGEQRGYTAIRQVAAYAADGTNVLEFPVRTTLADAKVFTQKSPDYYKGMIFAFHGGPNMVNYLRVEEYVPTENRLYLEFYGGRQYKQTRYCLLNSVRLIDVPGEYSVEPTDDEKTWRVYLLPEKLTGDAPAGISYSRRAEGVSLQGTSHVSVQGFVIQRQGNHRAVAGVSARGPAENVVIRDCDVSLVRGGAGITTYQVNRVLVDRCNVHHCPGHSKGIVLRNGRDVTTQHCTLVKNTSTGLDYYTCTDGKVIGNTVLDHRGMHANGLTFYLGCKNILIEGNRVSRGNICLTFQEAEDLTIRNNIFDGSGRTTVVGIWPGQPLKNVRFFNNCMVRSNHEVSWQTGLFTNSRKIEGLIVKNNIIDGLCGDPPFPKDAVFSHNLYTRLGPDREGGKLAEAEFLEADLKKIFVDPDNDDFRLREGSPAIDAGTGAGADEDIDGVKRPQGKGVDIGAYEYVPGKRTQEHP